MSISELVNKYNIDQEYQLRKSSLSAAQQRRSSIQRSSRLSHHSTSNNNTITHTNKHKHTQQHHVRTISGTTAANSTINPATQHTRTSTQSISECVARDGELRYAEHFIKINNTNTHDQQEHTHYINDTKHIVHHSQPLHIHGGVNDDDDDGVLTVSDYQSIEFIDSARDLASDGTYHFNKYQSIPFTSLLIKFDYAHDALINQSDDILAAASCTTPHHPIHPAKHKHTHLSTQYQLLRDKLNIAAMLETDGDV